ncbi:MAG: phosphatase PAP2 family protein [Oscillospiraceae bacterium]|nr:phosphatase PAP2 family protein [Oscillospiraceae bacterium]
MEATAAALWINSTFAAFDQGVTAAVHGLYDSAGWFFTPFLNLITILGKGGIFLILLSIALMLSKKTRRFGTAMLLGLAIGALITNLFIKIVIARPRPYTDEAGFYFPLWDLMGRHMESDKSFPSGHTTAAFAATVPVFLLGKKRVSWTALIFAFLMGLSRIYLVVHYPTDVIGGLIVGTFAGIIAVIVSQNAIPKKFYYLDFFPPKKEKPQKAA